MMMLPKPRTVYLTTGLRHVPNPRLLKPGEAFIVRFKNSLRQYKTDVWIGVVLPHMFGPSRHINRRPPSGAQPEEGDWTTHFKDRIYSFYLPGRNMYRWAGLNDIFILDEKTINVMNRSGRQDEGKVWQALVDIIQTKPDIEYWKNMSLQELGSKGNRGRDLRIVMANEDDDEDQQEDGEKDSSDEVDKESSHSSNQASIEVQPNTAQETNSASVDSQNASTGFDEPLSRPTNGQTSSMHNMSYTTVSLRHHREVVPSSVPRTHIPKPESLPKRDLMFHCPSFLLSEIPNLNSNRRRHIFPNHENSIKMENNSRPLTPNGIIEYPPSIFSMDLNQALAHAILNEPQSEKILDVFRNLLAVQENPIIIPLRSFLTNGEFLPRAIPCNQPAVNLPQMITINDSENRSTEHLLGDKMAIGQAFYLEGVDGTGGLRDGITVLGAIYQQAKNFGMKDLIYSCTFKLQIAWNSYTTLVQCKYLLEVATIAFRGDYILDEEHDTLQKWFIPFLAETYDLFVHCCHNELLALLRANPNLQNEVLERRSSLHLRQPQLFSDTRVLLRSRGINHL